jgi:hypothetical protein
MPMTRRRSITVGRGAALAALLGPLVAPATAQQSDIAAGISSSLVTRGIVLGRREPSLQANAAYYAANGFYAGVSGATLRFPTEANRAVQLTARAGWLLPFAGDWMATFGLQRVAYPFDDEWGAFAYDEASVGVAYADLAALTVSQLRYSGGYDQAASQRSWAVDLIGRYPLQQQGWSLTAGIGYYDLKARYGYGYTYGHAGVGLRLGRAGIDLAYTLTDSTAKAHFGAAAADHWTASVFWHF